MYIMNMHYYYNIIVKGMDVYTVFSLPTVKQGNLAQQIARALNKLPDKIAFVNIGGGGGVTPPTPPRSYAPDNEFWSVCMTWSGRSKIAGKIV